MQKKIEQILFDFEIIAFELVALNTRFYWETIHFMVVNGLKKSLKILDTTLTELFKLILSINAQKILVKYCREDLNSVSDPLTCSLYLSVLTRCFLGT